MCSLLPRLEKCRFLDEAKDDRLCKMCDGNCVKNEFNFLINCNFYNNLRVQHFSQIKNVCTLCKNKQFRYFDFVNIREQKATA